MNLTFGQLRELLNDRKRFPYDWDDSGVSFDNWHLVSPQFTNGRLEDKICQLEDQINDIEDDAKSERRASEDRKNELDERIEELEEELDEANNALADVRDPENSERSLKYYIEEAKGAREGEERALKIAGDWRKTAENAEEELEALRRRKGVEANMFRNLGKIKQLISNASAMGEAKYSPDNYPHFTQKAVKELALELIAEIEKK